MTEVNNSYFDKEVKILRIKRGRWCSGNKLKTRTRFNILWSTLQLTVDILSTDAKM